MLNKCVYFSLINDCDHVSFTLKMAPKGSPETSVSNYLFMLRNIPEKPGILIQYILYLLLLSST